jgi:hypothetical protein
MAGPVQKTDAKTDLTEEFQALAKRFYNDQMKFAVVAINPDSAAVGVSAAFSRKREAFLESHALLAGFCINNVPHLVYLLELSLASRPGEGAEADKKAVQLIKSRIAEAQKNNEEAYALPYSAGAESPGRLNVCLKTKREETPLFYFYYVEGGNEKTGSAEFHPSDEIYNRIKLTDKENQAVNVPLASVPKKAKDAKGPD